MKKNERWHGSFKAMGTDVEIDLVSCILTEKQIGRMMCDIQMFFEKMEQIFSRFRTNSELCQVNAHLGSYVQVSSEFCNIVTLAMMYHAHTDHMFDPRIYGSLVQNGYDRDFWTHHSNYVRGASDEEKTALNIYDRLHDDIFVDQNNRMVMAKRKIDLSGIVKGWTVDRVRDMIDHRISGYMIDAGGDMWVQGKDHNEKPWYIGIEGVDDRECLIQVENAAIATSGITRRQWTIDGQRYHHLIDPYDNTKFSFDINTVTVIAQSVVEADVLAKTLFLMDKEKRKLYITKNKVPTIIVDYEHNLYISPYAQKNII